VGSPSSDIIYMYSLRACNPPNRTNRVLHESELKKERALYQMLFAVAWF